MRQYVEGVTSEEAMRAHRARRSYAAQRSARSRKRKTASSLLTVERKLTLWKAKCQGSAVEEFAPKATSIGGKDFVNLIFRKYAKIAWTSPLNR